MNCQNCGAPMTLFPERGYFFCEYCKSYYFPSESPDGVRLLGKAPEEIQCPVCHIRLLIASFDGEHHGYFCEKCKGILLGREPFVETIASRRAWATEPPEPQGSVDRAHLERQVRCPLCENVMETHPYYGPGTFVIDSCVPCNVLWLDYGELERAVNAPGRDRGAALRREARVQDIELGVDGSKRDGIEVDLTALLTKLFF